ncbi:EAL domain-containing protein [Rhodoferax sp.]|uniref:putative bifunctional diguanylate cyclase/phosphodiesterase n=1 Tax=Rhodoferax sp. TaxID=50421 RepID=UPI00262A03E8|nr:EAL domain-containing protein [Rhodoferax sp.]MDD2924515.1 EAL domain-containing protein [Rhodoferax sp.]
MTQTTLSPTRLLIVDDNPLVLSSLQAALQRPDYEISLADSGLEAVRQLNTRPFDLVVLDLVLPDISGHEVMDYINSNQLGADVIAISGVNDIEAAIGSLKRGAYDFLRKTCPREELINTVDNALRARRLKLDNQRISRQLESSEKIYRHLIDSSPDIIYTLDERGHFTFINDRVQSMLGWQHDELLGQHYSVLVHPADLERAHYVLGQGKDADWVNRNVELQLKSRAADAEARLFSHEIMHTTLPATGLARGGQRGIYGIAHDLTERKRTEALLTYQAFHDVLTNLPNRTLFKDRLELSLLQSRRNQTQVAVLLIDLDRFKLINDTLGHGLGDELLRQTAERLKTSLRRCDTLARLGDDEFTVILPELASAQDAAQIADKCLASFLQPFELPGQVVHVTASMGVALHPEHGNTADDLLKSADMAMYHQKANGKNGYAFFKAAMQVPTTHSMVLEHDLRRALENGELEMYYQPQVDVLTQSIIGAEALMRWNHPQRGLLGAGEFLPQAEENGLIIPMTDWALETACRHLREWNARSGKALRMSINLSPQYLDRGQFSEKLQSALERHQLPASQFEVEVTENICIRNPVIAIEQLHRLCQLGVSIAIDDFGTGYSSLSYLHRFPIHTLKIDRAFVMGIHDETTPQPVVLAIMSIAKGLGLHLVAEGVETVTQRNYLAQAGCQTFQGYYYHRPMSQDRLLALL